MALDKLSGTWETGTAFTKRVRESTMSAAEVHARNKLKRTFLETTTLTITAVVDIWPGTDVGTPAVE